MFKGIPTSKLDRPMVGSNLSTNSDQSSSLHPAGDGDVGPEILQDSLGDKFTLENRKGLESPPLRDLALLKEHN